MLQMPTMVPVPSSYQQAMSYVASHGGSINPASTPCCRKSTLPLQVGHCQVGWLQIST